MRLSSLFILCSYLTVIDGASNCPSVSLKNGRAKVRSKGRMVYFRCRKRFDMMGSRMAVCINDQWTNPPPVCVAARCGDIADIPGVTISKSFSGAVIDFQCANGEQKRIYCDGKRWSSDPLQCKAQTHESATFCDFESEDLCGWSNDMGDDFDWLWHTGSTQTRNTGPNYDHTFGTDSMDGHYLFIESSAPRLSGHKAVLVSPMYTSDYSGRCFAFWYHMLGPNGTDNVGSLQLFIRQDMGDAKPALFVKEGNQGDRWIRGEIFIDTIDTSFQIQIVATRKGSFVSDIAVDDVGFVNCTKTTTPPETTSLVMKVSTDVGTVHADITTTEANTTPRPHGTTDKVVPASTMTFLTSGVVEANNTTSTVYKIQTGSTTLRPVSTNDLSNKTITNIPSRETTLSTYEQSTRTETTLTKSMSTSLPTGRSQANATQISVKMTPEPTTSSTAMSSTMTSLPSTTRTTRITTTPTTTVTMSPTSTTTTFSSVKAITTSNLGFLNISTDVMTSKPPSSLMTSPRTRNSSTTILVPSFSTKLTRRTSGLTSTVQPIITSRTPTKSTSKTVMSSEPSSPSFSAKTSKYTPGPTLLPILEKKSTKSPFSMNTFSNSSTQSTKDLATENATSVKAVSTNGSNHIGINKRKYDEETNVQPLVIGIGVGIAVGLVVLAILIWVYVKQQRQKREFDADEMTPITRAEAETRY